MFAFVCQSNMCPCWSISYHSPSWWTSLTKQTLRHEFALVASCLVCHLFPLSFLNLNAHSEAHVCIKCNLPSVRVHTHVIFFALLLLHLELVSLLYWKLFVAAFAAKHAWSGPGCSQMRVWFESSAVIKSFTESHHHVFLCWLLHVVHSSFFFPRVNQARHSSMLLSSPFVDAKRRVGSIVLQWKHPRYYAYTWWRKKKRKTFNVDHGLYILYYKVFPT